MLPNLSGERMPSVKSQFYAFALRHTRKKAFASAEGLHRWIARSRRIEDHRPPRSIGRRFDIDEWSVRGFPVYEIAPPELRTNVRMVYIHGGAYCFQITHHHWRLIAEYAERLGMRISVPVYPLAPEHDFYAMFSMMLEHYNRTLEETPSARIVFAGDSAGGNMAVVLTMLAVEQGLPAPSRHLLISPGVDMTLNNPQVSEVAKTDPWLDIPGGREAIRLYSAGIDVADWRISPLYGNLAALPPSLIFTGTRDILYPDTRIFAERLRELGTEAELVVGDGMFHVWPLLNIPEARKARDRMVEFLRQDAGAPPATMIN